MPDIEIQSAKIAPGFPRMGFSNRKADFLAAGWDPQYRR
jgi:hypothetical protein